MKRKRLPPKNAVYTPDSGTTVMVNYHEKYRILEVEFTGGRAYHYYDVPLNIWEEYKEIIRSGGSSGEFVNYRIKPFYEVVSVKEHC